MLRKEWNEVKGKFGGKAQGYSIHYMAAKFEKAVISSNIRVDDAGIHHDGGFIHYRVITVIKIDRVLSGWDTVFDIALRGT